MEVHQFASSCLLSTPKDHHAQQTGKTHGQCHRERDQHGRIPCSRAEDERDIIEFDSAEVEYVSKQDSKQDLFDNKVLYVVGKDRVYKCRIRNEPSRGTIDLHPLEQAQAR